ncbi:hypothetical protein HK101_011190 [Irineochytrium annulatum]|nr:hypothetical protein HK101_011190 [Irineochytrium annulatum]
MFNFFRRASKDSNAAAGQATGAVVYQKVAIVPPTDASSVPKAILPRMVALLKQVVPTVVVFAPDQSVATELVTTLILAVGNNPTTRHLINQKDLDGLGGESYVIRSHADPNRAPIIAIDGVPHIDQPKAGAKRSAREWAHGNRGIVYGLYAALEQLGFAFLHPLRPSVPPALKRVNKLNITETPRWSQFRAIHYHTQHPLELTPFLQGFGDTGCNDEPGWRSHMPEWELFAEWLMANRQNSVEWAMLESGKWEPGFARGDERIGRMKEIVDAAHAYGVAVGVDVPIAFAQQHSFRLLKTGTGKEGHLEAEMKEIRESLDWVMKAGFDFLGTENGTSEFTHLSPKVMLSWMNAASDYAAEKYGVPMHVKVHCSSGQFAKGYVDPRTGKDINYNMLPSFASGSMGVLPHTVESYSLDDPAPTYGNKNFGYMRDYIKWELEKNERSVVFYPETAYWVSVDIDLPLFLPLYADRRSHDLRLLAMDEEASVSKARMDGQLIFSSGWEWGYWLNDVVAARGAWDPKAGYNTSRDAFIAQLDPLMLHLAPEIRAEAEQVMRDWVTAQHELLTLGKVGDSPPPEDVTRRNGQAYLQGWDTWDDVSKVLGKLTQPDRIGLIELKENEKWKHFVKKALGRTTVDDKRVNFEEHVQPLLKAMDEQFAVLADRTEALAAKVPEYLKDLWDDVADACMIFFIAIPPPRRCLTTVIARMTALRSRQVRYLYEYVNSIHSSHRVFRAGRGDEAMAKLAMDALHEAQKVVARREPRYRVPVERVGSWTGLNTVNPTAYGFNYLWTVHSLHYFWRDAAQALIPTGATSHASFSNIIDPIEVGLGEGKALIAAEQLAMVLSALGIGRNFFDLAEKEPQYPQDIPRWKEI